MTIYFTADLHFFHKNILNLEGRPFADMEAMHEGLIKNWNNTVKPEDEVYILGDFSFKNSQTLPILQRLNGRKYLIKGNHDHYNDTVKAHFVWIKDYFVLRHEGKEYVLFHYPIESWDNRRDGAIHLHGHIHGKHKWTMANRVNIGVDSWDYTPVCINRLNDIMQFTDEIKIEDVL